MEEQDLDFELAREFRARVLIHKRSVLGGVLMLAYKQHEKDLGGVNLPDTTIDQQAGEYSSRRIHEALANGTFNKMYEDAWNIIAPTMPEYLNCMQTITE
jgi:hypothetical protein